MLYSQNNESSQKQILQKLINQRFHLNKIHQKQPLIFLEILKVFGINESKQNHEALYKLKERLINICIQQKQDFLQYLSLPKFKQTSQHALQLLKVSMKEIKQLVKNQQQKAKSKNVIGFISQLIPQYKNLYDLENYHLSIFQLYSKSIICPKIYSPNQNLIKEEAKLKILSKVEHYPFQNLARSNFVKSQPQQIKQQKFSSRNFIDQGEKFYKKISKDYHRSQEVIYQRNYQKSQPFQNNSSPLLKIPSKNTKRSSTQLIQDYSPSRVKTPKIDSSAKIYEDYSQPLSNLSESRNRTFEVLDPYFKNCICRGKISKVGHKEFSCQICLNKYHFECLGLQNSSKLQKKRCPICTVQECKNDFFQIMRPALTSSWAICNKKNNAPYGIKFNESLLNQITNIYRKQNHSIYLKMITISKRQEISHKNSDQRIQSMQQKVGTQQKILTQNLANQQIQSDKSESMMIDEQEGLNQSNNKNSNKLFQRQQAKTSIQLPQRYITEISKSSSPIISLNFGFKPQYLDKISNKFYKQQKVIYFGIYQIRKKTASQVINAYSQLFDQQMKCFTSENDITRKPILDLIEKNENYLSPNFIEKIKIKQNFHEEQDIQGDVQQAIYPIRFYKCKQLNHVFELKQVLTQFETNSRVKKLTPDTDLGFCPKCIQKGYSIQQLQNTYKIEDIKKGIYLDQMLFNLLNKNSKENYKNVNCSSIDIEMKVLNVTDQLQNRIKYEYILKSDEVYPQQIQEKQSDIAQNSQPVINQKNKQVQKMQQELDQKQQQRQSSQSIQNQHESIDYQS